MDSEIAPRDISEMVECQSMKRYIISSGITFIATFLTIFGANLLVTDTTEITGSIIASISIVAVRAAVKAVVEGLRV